MLSRIKYATLHPKRLQPEHTHRCGNVRYSAYVVNLKIYSGFEVDNIRMDLQEVGCGYVDWIGLALDKDGWRKLVNAAMNLRVP